MTPQPPDIVPIPPATQLSYDQANTLMLDLTFVGRVKVACLTFAEYVIGEPPNVEAHNTRYKWAQSCLANPGGTAQQVSPGVTLQPLVMTNGSAITDPDLQTATETTIKAMM